MLRVEVLDKWIETQNARIEILMEHACGPNWAAAMLLVVNTIDMVDELLDAIEPYNVD